MFVWLKTSQIQWQVLNTCTETIVGDFYYRVGAVVSGHWGGKMVQRLGDMQLANRTPFPPFPLLTYPSSFQCNNMFSYYSRTLRIKQVSYILKTRCTQIMFSINLSFLCALTEPQSYLRKTGKFPMFLLKQHSFPFSWLFQHDIKLNYLFVQDSKHT